MTQDRSDQLERIIDSGLVAIVRTASPEGVVEACEAMAEGGIRAVEVTMTTPNALEAIEQSRAQLGDDVLVGVGSVVDETTCREAIQAGAQFVVSPVYKPEVVEASHASQRPVLAGALTPTEILAAWEGGSDLVKVFPANHFGPRYFKDVLAPMPHLKLTPTGGVNLDTIPDWFAAGAACLGVGSALVRKDLVAEARWGELTDLARQFIARVDEARAALA